MFWTVHTHCEDDYSQDTNKTFSSFEEAITTFAKWSTEEYYSNMWITVHRTEEDVCGNVMAALSLKWDVTVNLIRYSQN